MGGLDSVLGWVARHPGVTSVAFALTLVTAVTTLIVAPVLVARMPASALDDPPPDAWRGRHSALGLGVIVTKNALGAVLVLSGVLLLALPGQGLVTIALGLMLLSIPGKRRLARRILGSPRIRRRVNRLRGRAGAAPLVFTPE